MNSNHVLMQGGKTRIEVSGSLLETGFRRGSLARLARKGAFKAQILKDMLVKADAIRIPRGKTRDSVIEMFFNKHPLMSRVTSNQITLKASFAIYQEFLAIYGTDELVTNVYRLNEYLQAMRQFRMYIRSLGKFFEPNFLEQQELKFSRKGLERLWIHINFRKVDGRALFWQKNILPAFSTSRLRREVTNHPASRVFLNSACSVQDAIRKLHLVTSTGHIISSGLDFQSEVLSIIRNILQWDPLQRKLTRRQISELSFSKIKRFLYLSGMLSFGSQISSMRFTHTFGSTFRIQTEIGLKGMIAFCPIVYTDKQKVKFIRPSTTLDVRVNNTVPWGKLYGDSYKFL